MITRTVNVKLPKNLSASPVALLVQKASKFDSIIYIEEGERKVNAKSIMGMMSITLDELPKSKTEQCVRPTSLHRWALVINFVCLTKAICLWMTNGFSKLGERAKDSNR